MARHNTLGVWGENLACEYLVSKGYAIVSRNWHTGNIEVDIIAMHNNNIIFIEVKTRSEHDSRPEEAVDRHRQQRLIRAADNYINQYNIPHSVQFDVIAISGNEHDYNIVHFEDAFYPRLRRHR